jgi:hypothetical protein
MTVVPAGRAVGKSFLLAGLVLWWVDTRPKSLVIIGNRNCCPIAVESLRAPRAGTPSWSGER